MIYGLGPRARRIYVLLRDRIVSGDLSPGTRLPAHLILAREFGVAPLTMRNVLAQLEEDGFVSRQPGRGTFVEIQRGPPSVLIVGARDIAEVLLVFVVRAHQPGVVATSAAEALHVLHQDCPIALVISGLDHAPGGAGLELATALEQARPRVRLATVVRNWSEVRALQQLGHPPVLWLPMPLHPATVAEVVELTLVTHPRLTPASPHTTAPA